MKLTEKIKNIFLYLGLDKVTYKKIESRIQEENRRILTLMSSVVCIIMAGMSILNSHSSFLHTSTFFYIAGAITEITILALCLTVARRSSQIMPVLVEMNLIIVYALCVGIATFGSTESEPTVTLFVVMIFMPLIFIGRPITFTITNIITTVVFVILDQFKLPDVYSRDITNVVVYLILSTAISTWLIHTRADNKKLLSDIEEAKTKLAESYGIVEGFNKEYHAILLTDKDSFRMNVIRTSEDVSTHNALQLAYNTPDYKQFFSNYIRTYVDPTDRERVALAVDSDTVLKRITEPGIYTVNFLRINDDGYNSYHQVAFANVGSQDEAHSFVIGFRDVDAQVKEEQKKQQLLQDALNYAEYASKAKTIFLNNMSHDIRTPMNAIVGFTALAGAHIDDKQQVQDYLKKITASSQHLLSLINDVLDMSRIESGKMKIEEKQVHLPDVLHDLRNIIQVSVSDKQLSLFIDTIDVTNEDVICDPLRLNQVLLNLTSNAIKFTPSGGYVSIKLTQKPAQDSAYANFEFRVKDNGIGMSKEFEEHVFDSFAREENTTVSKIQGTGLGMSITKNIVDMMGGTIEVESEKGKGTEFIVTVPLVIAGDVSSDYTIPTLQGIRALVVDDESTCCISVCDMLTKIGLRTDWTLSGHEAILRAEVAKKQNDSYGVFIIDFIMPDMNGIETVRRIRRVIGNEAPIIVLTAYDWSDIEKEAREAGVTAFCSKPLFISELHEVLSKPYVNESASAEPEEETVDFTGHRILLVEDNELNREIASTLLSDYGLEIEEAEDGSIAVQKIMDAAGGYYELILMDIQMPILNGYEATKQIRALEDPTKASIPIFAMTANAFEEDRRQAIEVGMNGHLSKPIDIRSVISIMQTYLLH